MYTDSKSPCSLQSAVLFGNSGLGLQLLTLLALTIQTLSAFMSYQNLEGDSSRLQHFVMQGGQEVGRCEGAEEVGPGGCSLHPQI